MKSITSKLNDTDKNDCVLEKFDIKAKKNGTSTLLTMNGIQFALFSKFYRVMMVLLTKVIHLREYLGEYELLEQAMESEEGKRLTYSSLCYLSRQKKACTLETGIKAQ